MTVSGCHRGDQRRLYDERRRTVFPAQGVRFLELDYTMFHHDRAKRLRRDPAADQAVIKAKLDEVLNAGDSLKRVKRIGSHSLGEFPLPVVRIDRPREREVQSMTTMKLHEAITKVLSNRGKAMTPPAIAEDVNRLGLYLRGDGEPVPANQIRARVRQYSDLFTLNNGLIDRGRR